MGLGSIAGGAIGGALGWHSSKMANKAARQRANAAMAFEGAQSQAAREWSHIERLQTQNFNAAMANTQIQRRMKDMAAAGVNPILGLSSAQGSNVPGSSPGQTAAGKGHTAPVREEMLHFATTAVAVAKELQALRLLKAQTLDVEAKVFPKKKLIELYNKYEGDTAIENLLKYWLKKFSAKQQKPKGDAGFFQYDIGGPWDPQRKNKRR